MIQSMFQALLTFFNYSLCMYQIVGVLALIMLNGVLSVQCPGIVFVQLGMGAKSSGTCYVEM